MAPYLRCRLRITSVGVQWAMPEEIKTLDEHISAAEFDARLMRSNQEALARLEKDEDRLRHLETLVAEKEALAQRLEQIWQEAQRERKRLDTEIRRLMAA
jgi:SMC interacting uncharacterized protein involved in chromosome segregation